MASVNKESLREEFGALQDRFARLSADGKITAESGALLEALLMLLKVLMAVFMEKNTPKNSTNSSKPGSQTPKDDTALTRAGTHGKGKELTASCPGRHQLHRLISYSCSVSMYLTGYSYLFILPPTSFSYSVTLCCAPCPYSN